MGRFGELGPFQQKLATCIKAAMPQIVAVGSLQNPS